MANKMKNAAARTGWGAPPPDGRTASQLAMWLDDLKQRPGEWGWREYAKGAAGQVRARLMAAGFEAVTRGSRVYARWVVTP